MRAVEDSSDDGESNHIDDIHITDSGGLIKIQNSSAVDGDDNFRGQLAEFASELLRLQEQPGAKPRRTGAFAPEALRRLTHVICDPPLTPGGPGTSPSPPATPSRDVQATPLDSLPTPTSTADGRSDAAGLLRSRIQKMQMNSEGDVASEQNEIADFTGEGMDLRIKKGEAEAAAALLSAELVALRGKHEEEKRSLMKTAEDLRRRNEELEHLITLQRLGSNNAGGPEASNGRSASCIQLREREEREGENNKFGFRMKALAQRWASPHPARGGLFSATAEEEERQATRRPSEESGPGSCSSTINTHEDFGHDLSGKEIQSTRDESLKVIAALEEQLRHSEHHANVLQQRLIIVKESGDAVIQSLNEELADLAEDQARSETAMIKELSILDSQRRAERNEYEKRIQDWIVHDANRKLEVEEYETRIQSLLNTVRMMNPDVIDCHVGANSSSSDGEAVQDMKKDLINYIELLGNSGKGKGKGGNMVLSINGAFDLEFNANPIIADGMIEYYRSRPELKDFTLKSELPRMDYEVLVADEETGKDIKLVSTDEIRSYFSSLDEANKSDEEIETIIRAANQSLLADPLAMLTGEGDGKLVHSGSFHSTVIATVCSFKLDLRREGERRIKVECELAICVPSGLEPDKNATVPSDNDEKEEKVKASLELARANLLIQFSPSPTSTPSGPLVKYHLMDIKPTISDYKEGNDNARAIQSAAAALARDRHSHIQSGKGNGQARHNLKNSFLSKVKQFSSNRSSTPSD